MCCSHCVSSLFGNPPRIYLIRSHVLYLFIFQRVLFQDEEEETESLMAKMKTVRSAEQCCVNDTKMAPERRARMINAYKWAGDYFEVSEHQAIHQPHRFFLALSSSPSLDLISYPIYLSGVPLSIPLTPLSHLSCPFVIVSISCSLLLLCNTPHSIHSQRHASFMLSRISDRPHPLLLRIHILFVVPSYVLCSLSMIGVAFSQCDWFCFLSI